MEKEQQMGPEMKAREAGGKSQKPGEHVSRRK